MTGAGRVLNLMMPGQAVRQSVRSSVCQSITSALSALSAPSLTAWQGGGSCSGLVLDPKQAPKLRPSDGRSCFLGFSAWLEFLIPVGPTFFIVGIVLYGC